MPPYLIILTAAVAAIIVFFLMCMVMVLIVYKKMFGYHFEHDPLVTTYSPEKVGVTSIPVEIDLNGQTIRGCIYTPKDKMTDASSLIILCHGMWSSHRSYMQEVGYLCSHGYEVLAFDYIGTATSDGKTLGGFGQSLRCLDRVVSYVKNDPKLSNRKIWVFGHSWGGYAASNIIKFHPDIHGIVAIAPAVSYEAVIRNVFPKGIHFLIPTAKLIDKIKTGRYANQNAVKSLSKYNGKAIFLHSEDDPMCPYTTTTGAIKKKYGSKFDYVVLRDKGHHPQYTYDGLKLMAEYNKALKSAVSEDEKADLKRSTNFLAIGALDGTVMEKIIDYIGNN